ncbi:hypothetical protein [Solibacillus sp. FSL H8-0538]|uniref:hypothetical protein n=1 Tax=Solibacillus sp. FSL H8-0538 TaxID=2921400 RepID=UPI0030F76495
MNNKSTKYLPLLVTVGQVVIFPYYILWLKQVSLTFTMFAWLFALHSFAAAFGYRLFQKRKPGTISFIYIGMGAVYVLVSLLDHSFELLLYVVLILQVFLGAMQGYFRAWHVQQKSYHLDAVHHYVIVGVTMLGLSFMKIISPVVFLGLFGGVVCLCGIWEYVMKCTLRRKRRSLK